MSLLMFAITKHLQFTYAKTAAESKRSINAHVSSCKLFLNTSDIVMTQWDDVIPAWEIFVAVEKASGTIKCVSSIVDCRTLATNTTIGDVNITSKLVALVIMMCFNQYI